VQWLSALPDTMQGVVVGNEVLDAMPVQLLCWDGARWLERGVAAAGDGAFAWQDRPTALAPPLDVAQPEQHFMPGYVTEIHPQQCAFVATLAERLTRGAAFFIDYGFPEAEYYHPQRRGGTLICHRAHRADADPLIDLGEKDITAHVNFTAIALAAQDAGMEVLGYTSQARFLFNCGMLAMLQSASLATRTHARRLIDEHEMGELFKVIAFARGCSFDAVGFVEGDRPQAGRRQGACSQRREHRARGPRASAPRNLTQRTCPSAVNASERSSYAAGYGPRTGEPRPQGGALNQSLPAAPGSRSSISLRRATSRQRANRRASARRFR
jgi:hypothetical protein